MRAKLLNKITGQKIEESAPDVRLITSLILEYLTCANFKFTLSVFVPECGDPDAFFSPAELGQYFSLAPSPAASILSQLINNYSAVVRKKTVKDSAAQTVDSSAVSALEERLLALDRNFAQNKANESPRMEEKMMKFQRETENRMQAELKNEVQRIRETEITAMKLEEANKYQQLLQRNRSELEKKFEKEFEALRAKEIKSLEMIKSKEAEIEHKAFVQRQDVLRDTEKNKEIINEYRVKIEKNAQETENIRRIWEERMEVHTSQLKKVLAENDDLKIRNKELDRDMNRARKEIKILADSQNRLMSELNIKEGEFRLLANEHDHFQVLFGELKERLNRAKTEHEAETDKLKKALHEYAGKDIVSDYLLERKQLWNKLEREELEIRKGIFDILKPTPLYSPSILSEESNRANDGKTKTIDVKTKVVKYEVESATSEEDNF
jgi:chromosome segregation ATPase